LVDDLRTTAAFTLIALEASGARACWHWNGVRLEHRRGKDVPEFFSSSSYRTAEVIAARRMEFERVSKTTDEESRREFHFSHDMTRGAESVLMSRPDANTRSVSCVRVGTSEAVLEYVPVGRGEAGPVLGAVCRYRLPRSDAQACTGESR
jgi:hypothetical protein